MKIRSNKAIIVVIIIFLISCNLSFQASNSEPESATNSSTRSNQNRDAEFALGQIEIISEPIPGQNINTGPSRRPKIAVEGNKIYTIWSGWNDTNGAGTDADIIFKYFDGNSWSEPQVISEPIEGKDLNIADSKSPDFKVENGNIYVVWEDKNNTNGVGIDTDIFFRCNLTGSGWGPIQVISEPTLSNDINKARSEFPAIDVENGNIYVMWGDQNNTDNAGIDTDTFFRCNLSGSNWDSIQVISEPVKGMNYNTGDVSPSRIGDIAVDNGKIYTVWEDTNNTDNTTTDYDIHFRCNLTAKKWEDIQVISEPNLTGNTNHGYNEFPNIAVENEKIYVIWRQDNWNYSGCGNDREIFLRCNLTKTTWEPIQVVSEQVTGKDHNIGLSSIVGNEYLVVENGNIFIVWTDGNDTDGSGTNYDVHFRCNLTNSGWEDIIVISEPIKGNNTFIKTCSYPAIAVSQGKCHIVWHTTFDYLNSGTDADVYYRCVQTPISQLYMSLPEVIPLYGNTSTVFNFSVTYNHPYNKTPTKINLKLNGVNYSMLQSDPDDSNYKDGKAYYHETRLNISTTHTYQFWATETSNILSTKIVNYPDVLNTVPEIITENNLTAIEEINYKNIYEYTDIDLANIGQIGSWDCSTNATWLTFNQATANLSGTPENDDVGEYWVNVSINDSIDIDFTNFTIEVFDVNDPPVINTTDVEVTYEDEPYVVDYEAYDVDSPLSAQDWSMETNASAWLVLNSETGVINGIPTNDEVGNYFANISVFDGEGGLDFTNFTLTVLNVNDPPVIITKDILETPIDELFEVDYNATDIDSPQSQLVWSLETIANWLTLDSKSGLLSGTPTISDFGMYDVNVSVFDGNGGSDYHAFNLVVTGENKPPTIITKDVVSALINELYYVDYEAIDDHTPADQLVWSLNTTADWLEIDAHTGELSGIPKSNDVGLYLVIITVNDTEGNFDFTNFSLNVYTTKNTPPKIITEDFLIAEVNVLYYVNYQATDDRTLVEHLEWYLKTNASWLNFNSKTGVISGTPSSSDIGFYFVNISVTDDENGRDYHNFTLLVIEELFENTPPILSNSKMSPEIGDTTTEFTFSVHYYDSDSDVPISIQLVTSIGTYYMELSTGEPANGTYMCKIKLHKGIHTYSFTASDGVETFKTERFSTPYIQEKKQDSKSDLGSLAIILVVSIVIVIILILLFQIFIWKRKVRRVEVEGKKDLSILTATAPETTTPQISTLPPTSQPIQPAQELIQPPTLTSPTIAPSVIPTTSIPTIESQAASSQDSRITTAPYLSPTPPPPPIAQPQLEPIQKEQQKIAE